MMATERPPSSSSFLPLLESVEDSAAGQSEQTDAYLTIANRLSGEEGRQFLPAVEKHFSRLGKAILAHMSSANTELSQAALQALGFCVYHSHVVSGLPESFATEILSALCSLVVKSTDKNTCTRALWVISKQSLLPEVVADKVSSILGTLENVWSREDVQSVVMEHEALNVVIRLLEQVPAQMGDRAVRWAKLVIPLVVHSASKVRLRAAAAMEMGMPLLLGKQAQVAAIIEPLMSSKLIPELQKLFMSKNETNVLKLWPLFVKLLGKLLHRGGPFINSLLHLEELGFRSSSPAIKKIAFIAWKSLIDNFALNPDILCSAKRMKLLMQPLTSINVRTETLLLTKVEVWWYLVVQLGPNLSSNFDQVSVPLLQCTIGSDSSSVPVMPSRSVNQNAAVTPSTTKAGTPSCNSSANMSLINLNSNVLVHTTFPSIQLLGLEMLLHYFLGPEAVVAAAKYKLILSLEPLTHPLLSGASSFAKHAAVLISNIREGFTNVGKDAPDPLLAVLWKSLAGFVSLTIESGGSKKERQGCEVLTLMLQALQSIVTSEALPAARVLVLFEATVRGIPQRVLGSASYQVGKMDVLNGTPALFLILLLYNSSMLSAYIEDERFFQCLQTLVSCGFSGPTSPLAFAEAVLGAIGRRAGSVQNKEQLFRMWSVVVSPLTDTITQSNEVNQGDALEHNFSAMHSALLFPVTHLLRGAPLQQAAQKSMLSTWSKLYKVFARCSALVVTAEENICCEELCAKMAASLDRDALMVPSTLNAVANILQVMVECVDFSPYTPQFQQKLKSPHTPVNWMRKRSKALGNLSTFQSLLVQCLEGYLEGPEASPEPTGAALVSILSAIFTNLALANAVQEALTSLIQPLTLFYKQAASDQPRFTAQLLGKLEKLVSEVLGCLQSRSTLAYDNELLALLSPLLCVLFPHKNKQLRTSVTQFWNSTFANSLSLTYPDEMRPILSQVKQKTPIILPGFEVVVVPDELSDQYSSESSQLETKLSGMPVSSVGKRDSLIGKDKSSTKTNKPVSTKLDFGSPKPPRKEVLEEEASVDFVFIPPETKERVLTEHQKEVKRTKRVDIPAMYNNLDASQDTTVFTQYTQSQEDSSDKLPTEQANNVTEEAPGKVPQEDVEKREDAEGQTEDTQDYASPEATAGPITEMHQQEETTPQSNVSVEEKTTSDERAEDMDVPSKERRSLRHSRRQYFITLEKYPEGKPASPSGMSTFTGPLIKTSNSQERANTDKTSSSQASHTATSPDSQDSSSTRTGQVSSQSPLNDTSESPRRPKDSRIKSEPVRLTERMSSDSTEDECVIPDTPVEAQGKSTTQMASKLEEIKCSSQKEVSEPSLGNSQSLGDSQSPVLQTSAGKPRRSGRNRVKPLLPELPSDSTEDECVITDTPTELQGSNSNQMDSTLEEMDQSSQKEDSEPGLGESQTSVTQTSPDEHCKVGHLPELCRDTAEDECLIPDTQCEVQDEMTIQKSSTLEEMKNSSQKEESEPTLGDSQSSVIQTSPGESRRPGRYRGKPPLPGENTDEREDKHTQLKRKRSGEEPKTDSPKLSSVQNRPNTRSKQAAEEESSRVQTRARSESSQTNSQGRTNKKIKLFRRSADFLVTPERRRRSTREHESSQTELQSDSQSDYDSQSQGRRRRQSKPSDKSDNKDPLGVQSRSNSQTVVSPDSQVEAKFGGRTRMSKVKEDLSSPSSTPKSSQSLNVAGSTESSSQGRGRYAGRRSSQVANMESSESESSEVRESSPVVKKRGRKPRVSLQSPLALESKDNNKDLAKDDADVSQQADTQSIEAENMKDLEDSQKTPDLQGSESLQVTSHAEEQINESLSMEVEGDPVLAVDPLPEKTETDIKKTHVSPRKQEPRDSETNACNTLLQETDTGDVEILESVGISHEQNQENSMDSAVDTLVPPGDTTDRLQVSESSEEKAEDVSETGRKNEDMAETEEKAEDVSEAQEKTEDAETGERDEDVSETEEKTEDAETGERDEDVSETEEKTEDAETGERDETEEKTEDAETGERDEDVSETEEKTEAVSETGERDEDVAETEEKTEAVSETGERDEDVAETREKTVAVSETGERDEDVAETREKTEDMSETGERDKDMAETKEKTEAVSETGESLIENQTDVSDQKEHPVVPVDTAGADRSTSSENHAVCPDVVDELSKGDEQFPSKQQTETSAEGEITSVQEDDNGSKIPTVGLQGDKETQSANTENDDAVLRDVCNGPVSTESTGKEVFQDSPEKQKDLEPVAVSDAGQSPINGKTKGTWSPSASPSTSILKKSQKRLLEEETPSPLVKSRRVSFADPIQQQETADDIDRRSPAVRTSSPRRSRLSGSQPKYVSTPTKGSLILSPRHLHSPGYKSSKKCLISEMSQEPCPVPRDCVYPALVGCSTPVEAVLPQISSTMWSRGFGQLVRARNIKTVGDLSALTPSDIKTLPIRSPKISNVKKALKVYEQQRKGRGGDELKSFDETEMMTSEPEETSAPQNQDEEERTSGETLATELLDEPVPADETPEPTCSGNPTLDTPAGERQLHPDGLLSEVEALTCRMTPGELGRCSPPQLVQMHDQLGDMMRRLVVELQTRLCHIDGRP